MTKMTKDELQVRYREIQDRMGDLNETAAREKRDFTEDEQREWNALTRESVLVNNRIEGLMTDEELMKHRQVVSKGEQLREVLKQANETGAKREILLFPADGNTTANITASGAIKLSIKDLMPTLNEGLGLPPTLNIVTGVTGNELWPVNINDVELEEVGEVVQLNDQVLDFAKITPVQKRCGLKVPVSNMAIDNTAFDLMGFVQSKFSLAQAKFLAKKVYSQANFSGLKGGFANLTKKGDINIGSNPYKAILKAVAAFANVGFEAGKVVLVMDCETEAELKATPKVAGLGTGFVIENGKCAGYDYVVSHWINTTLSGTDIVPTEKKYIGIGFFEYLAVQQHGDVRFVIDPITLADKNVTRVILNTAWSITDLSTRLNGGEETAPGSGIYKTQAFALYEVTGVDSSSDV